MSRVLNRTTGVAFPYRKDYRESVNTPDFPEADWIRNPDLSAVQGLPSKYWDIVGDSVVAVDQATRDARDAELAAADALREKEDAKLEIDTKRVLIAFADVVVDEINLLRQQFNATTGESNQLTTTALSDRTLAQLKAAIRQRIDAGG